MKVENQVSFCHSCFKVVSLGSESDPFHGLPASFERALLPWQARSPGQGGLQSLLGG